jgi:hypothetical protein
MKCDWTDLMLGAVKDGGSGQKITNPYVTGLHKVRHFAWFPLRLQVSA